MSSLGIERFEYRCKLCLCYLLWLPPFGLLGAHFLLLGHSRWALLYMFTLGLLGVGWFIDLLQMPEHVHRAVKRDAIKYSSIQVLEPYSLISAYKLWAVLGVFGGHHIYLNNRRLALLYAFTLGGFGLGWLFDVYRMRELVEQATVETELKLVDSACSCGSTDAGGSSDRTISLLTRPICVVCMEKPIDAVFLDCGHSMSCLRCGTQLLRNNENTCPMCRIPCKLKKIYISSAYDTTSFSLNQV